MREAQAHPTCNVMYLSMGIIIYTQVLAGCIAKRTRPSYDFVD